MTITIRPARPEDHRWIVSVVDHWWGRPVAAAVPRLYLDHFYSTSLVAERGTEPVGFLIGFMSPSQADVAYVHFVGVDPGHRSLSLGHRLYERFFEMAKSDARTTVFAVTNALNDGSIRFHRRMGFDVSEPIDGYDRPGIAHVRFSRKI